MPPDPPIVPFSFLDQLQIYSAEKKYAFSPPLSKFLATPLQNLSEDAIHVGAPTIGAQG